MVQQSLMRTAGAASLHSALYSVWDQAEGAWLDEMPALFCVDVVGIQCALSETLGVACGWRGRDLSLLSEYRLTRRMPSLLYLDMCREVICQSLKVDTVSSTH